MNLQPDNSPDSSSSAPPPNPSPVATESRFWAFVVGPQYGVVVALLALVVISFYVFACTPYQEFVYSDMKSFWVRAMDRLAGNQFADSQFVAWPPLYHIFLAEVFRVLGRIGLGTWVRLETALLINIAAFAISVYAFQRLAVHWFERRSLVLAVVLLYAIGFPALYFNAFLLSDNLGAALLVMAISVAVCRKGWGAVIAAALLFAAAAIIRPSLGPYGLAFVALYLGRYRFNWQFITRSALFSVLFFSAVFAASAEVSRISHGRVTGLSANGGLDFFIANADYHRVELNYDGWHFFIIVPSLSWKPEKGIFHTTVPFYNQDYYFRQGLEAIKRNPSRLWMNLEHVRNLFFADMLPSRHDAPGFVFFRPVWDWLKFGMFASLGLYFWMRRELGEKRSACLLFVSTVTLTLIVSYIFTGEPRYTYSIIFVFYLLFFKLVELIWRDWHRWRKTLAAYVGGFGGRLSLIFWRRRHAST